MEVHVVIDPQPYDVLLGRPEAAPDALAVFRYQGEQTTVVARGTGQADRREGPWRHIALEAALPFDTIGFFRRFADVLADAGVPILPFASFHFDHVLVPEGRLDDAVAAVQGVADDFA